jgi:alkanesulfonate monooxygenase SsuD/methylene tetrahydromethanopterin reductase-like flavin-dependent oxidoreductase (luciferase family)
MVKVGILIGDVPSAMDPREHLDALLRQVDAAQRAGIKLISIGQHFLYGDLRWLQPVPTLARLAAELDDDVRLATTIMMVPLYNPVILAEEIATLDVMTGGRLDFGVGLGYRSQEFDLLGVPYDERVSRMDEAIELMKLIWACEPFSFDGKHWQIEHAEPHIRPIQQPHPPLWIGAHSRAGARRAGRVGDAYTVPPEPEVDEINIRFDLVREGFAARGKEFTHQPVRRNVMMAPDHDAAVQRFIDVSRDRYIAYADRELDILDKEALERDFLSTVGAHAILGSYEEVIDQVRDFLAAVPADPLIIKPQWPTMSPDDVVAYLDEWGREVAPAVAEMDPAPLG